jgi:hypothetical protein
MTYREEVLTNITKQIEDKLGRLKPSVYEYREYEKKKAIITEHIRNIEKHFTEKDFPNWEQLLSNINITKSKGDFDDISSDENEHMSYRPPSKFSNTRK